MSYELEFEEKALKKFDKLNPQIAEQFINKLEASSCLGYLKT